MNIRRSIHSTTVGRHRSTDGQSPHVGECTFAGIRVLALGEQRDGSRVSAAGDAR